MFLRLGECGVMPHNYVNDGDSYSSRGDNPEIDLELV